MSIKYLLLFPIFIPILLIPILKISRSIRLIPPKNTEIILGGDVMLGRTVMTTSLDKSDPTYPFAQVADTLQKADLVFVNLENPFVTDCRRDYSSMIFCANPQMIKGLTFAGIDIVNLANNHSRNYGEDGFKETIDILTKNNIAAVGTNDNLVTKKVNSLTFGFLGFDFLTNLPKENDYALVRSSSQKVDILIIGVHWGIEYQGKPTENQKKWARKMVAQGADIVVGHHPHWVQTIELIDGKPVYYSLGNLIFDQMWSENTRQGLLIRLTIDSQGKIIKEEPLSIYMSSWSQPEFIKK